MNAMARSVLPLLVFALLAQASPRATQTTSSPTSTTTTPARPTCTVTHTDGADDTPSIVSAIASCGSNSTILFQPGVDYNTWTPAQFALGQNVDIQLLGNLHFSENITAVQKAVTGRSYKSGWFLVTGKNISLVGPGSTSTTGGGIYGYGQAWWDAVQQTSRPLLFAWKATNGTIKGVKIVKPIGKSFNLAGSGVLVDDVLIDAKSDTSAFPFNTDGIDVGGDGNIIQDSTFYNGDDCIAIGSPCMNLLVQRIKCVGSHGVSIAAKGGTVDVHNILVRDISVIDSLYGARYKSSGGGVGLAKNLVYENVYVQNVTFPIYVTQNYYDQSQSAPPPSNTSVTIDGLSFSGFAGTINSRHPGDGSCISNPCWYHVAAADGTQSIVFDEIYPGTVTALHTKDIAIVPQVAKLPTVICNSTEVSGLDVGFKCWDGLYIPTWSGI